VRISMDGRGRWVDNVFIERLWRSLKHEDVYLKGYPTAARPIPASLLGSRFTTRAPPPSLGTTARRWWPGESASAVGHDAALGQRWRVAHIPTAAAITATANCRLIESSRRAENPTNKPVPVVPQVGSTSAPPRRSTGWKVSLNRSDFWDAPTFRAGRHTFQVKIEETA